MATILQPPQLPFEILILIFLPYFVAVIAAIIYTNKHIKKVGNIVEDKEERTPRTINHNLATRQMNPD